MDYIVGGIYIFFDATIGRCVCNNSRFGSVSLIISDDTERQIRICLLATS